MFLFDRIWLFAVSTLSNLVPEYDALSASGNFAFPAFSHYTEGCQNRPIEGKEITCVVFAHTKLSKHPTSFPV